jgi:hypothetical protein
MIQIDLSDPRGSIRRVDVMIGKIAHFKQVDIGQELSAWQTEDMHRRRAFTMRKRRAGQASTIIRPHSLYEMVGERGGAKRGRGGSFQRRVAGKLRRLATNVMQRIYRRWSTRPILRVELYETLETRMLDLMNKKLRWK